MNKSSMETTSAARHTPSPWRIGHEVRNGGICPWATIWPGDKIHEHEIIARIYDQERVVLISAAPELLSSLERAVAASDEPGSDYDWIGEAVRIIAKARGQQ